MTSPLTMYVNACNLVKNAINYVYLILPSVLHYTLTQFNFLIISEYKPKWYKAVDSYQYFDIPSVIWNLIFEYSFEITPEIRYIYYLTTVGNYTSKYQSYYTIPLLLGYCETIIICLIILCKIIWLEFNVCIIFSNLRVHIIDITDYNKNQELTFMPTINGQTTLSILHVIGFIAALTHFMGIVYHSPNGQSFYKITQPFIQLKSKLLFNPFRSLTANSIQNTHAFRANVNNNRYVTLEDCDKCSKYWEMFLPLQYWSNIKQICVTSVRFESNIFGATQKYVTYICLTFVSMLVLMFDKTNNIKHWNNFVSFSLLFCLSQNIYNSIFNNFCHKNFKPGAFLQCSKTILLSIFVFCELFLLMRDQIGKNSVSYVVDRIVQVLDICGMISCLIYYDELQNQTQKRFAVFDKDWINQGFRSIDDKYISYQTHQLAFPIHVLNQYTHDQDIGHTSTFFCLWEAIFSLVQHPKCINVM